MKSFLNWSELCQSLAPAIVKACHQYSLNPTRLGLTQCLHQELPEWTFRPTLSRGGWYRLGQLISAQGQSLAPSLEAWAEEQLEHHDHDYVSLQNAHADVELYASRITGKTHYLVCETGDKDDDFLQLEIEELQEVRAHRLFDNDPTTFEELVDPREKQDEALPIGRPRYQFRRIQHMGAFLERLQHQKTEPAPVHRLLQDWAASSAGAHSGFCQHWVIATREHLDRYQQTVLTAQAIPVLAGGMPDLALPSSARGVALQDALNRFDRKQGYPMSWFFLMATNKGVPHDTARAVVEDALNDFAYLPQRDIDVVRRWLHQPYSA